jgi:hypothetical protein
VGRDYDHRGGRARGGPGRGGSLDAQRALNDRDTGAEEAVTFPDRQAILDSVGPRATLPFVILTRLTSSDPKSTPRNEKV